MLLACLNICLVFSLRATLQPSVSRKDRKAYDALRLRLRSTRSHIQPDADAPVQTTQEGPSGDVDGGGDGGQRPVGRDSYGRDGDGDAVLEDASAPAVAEGGLGRAAPTRSSGGEADGVGGGAVSMEGVVRLVTVLRAARR